MFKQLKSKWNVTPKQFWIIFIAFGCTGITTAYFTKQIAALAGMDSSTWWVWKTLLRIGMLLIGYQVLLLFYGALFGQWKFFWSYEKKLLQKLRILKKPKIENRKSEMQQSDNYLLDESAQKEVKRIAIFASGAGTNAERIIKYFKNHDFIKVELIVCNVPAAGVLKVAGRHNVKTLLIDQGNLFSTNKYVEELEKSEIDFIVLAGFLWKVPLRLIEAYRHRIINIHPALLPKYGGKGMYGSKVHEAVIEAGEKESGITIHHVDEHYDNGDVIFQAKCEVEKEKTPASLGKKIHELEHAHYPKVIEKTIGQLL